MAKKFDCNTCGREFRSTDRFVATTKGKCPTCVKGEGLPRKCVSCSQSFVWYEQFAQAVGHPQQPQLQCPTCVDKMSCLANKDQPVIVEREALHVWPVAQVCINMEDAELCDPEDKAKDGRNPARRKIFRDNHGKSYDGRLDIYDYRPDGSRGTGSLARLRVMAAKHKDPREVEAKDGSKLVFKDEDKPYIYLVLEPVTAEQAKREEEPPVALILASYAGKSASKGGKPASGGVKDDQAHWSVVLTSSSRKGAHWGATVIGIVDDEHPLLVRQDNNLWRWGRTECVLEEPGFRDHGLARLSIFLPSAEGEEVIDSLKGQGFYAKLLAAGGVVVKPRREEEGDGFLLPENLPADAQLRIESVEEGGGYTHTGHAQVVCSLEGEQLAPFATGGHRGSIANGQHGWFSAPEGLATIQAVRWTKSEPEVTVELATHSVVQDGLTARIESEVLFCGDPEKLPEHLSKFAEAAKAAAAKSTDYHCRGLYFAS